MSTQWLIPQHISWVITPEDKWPHTEEGDVKRSQRGQGNTQTTCRHYSVMKTVMLSFVCLFVCLFLRQDLPLLPGAREEYSGRNSAHCNLHLPGSRNSPTLGGRGWWITRSRDQDHPGQHGETLCLLKIQKISRAWWHVPVVSATQEAEAGESLEPGRQTLQ